jgi:hypothetical protein
MKNKILTMLLMGIMGGTLITIGIWQVFENAVWLWVAGIGAFGLLEANKIFNKLQFGEIEVEGEEEA